MWNNYNDEILILNVPKKYCLLPHLSLVIQDEFAIGVKPKLSSLVSASACHVSHSHLLRGDPPPACAYCRRPLSIRHLLIKCPCYLPIRSRHYRSLFLCFYLHMYFACLKLSFCVTLFLMYFSFYCAFHSFFCLLSSSLFVTLTSDFCFPKWLLLRPSRHDII